MPLRQILANGGSEQLGGLTIEVKNMAKDTAKDPRPAADAAWLPRSLRLPLLAANRLLDEYLGLCEAAKLCDCETLYKRLVGAFNARFRLEELLERVDDELRAAVSEPKCLEGFLSSSMHRCVLDEASPLLLNVAIELAKAESVAVVPAITRELVKRHQSLLQTIIPNFWTWAVHQLALQRADLEHEAYQAFTARIESGLVHREDLAEEMEGSFAADDLIVDPTRFEVRLGNRVPCKLGNNRLFRFFEVLANHLDRFVGFEDIAEEMGHNPRYVPILKTIKCVEGGSKWRRRAVEFGGAGLLKVSKVTEVVLRQGSQRWDPLGQPVLLRRLAS